MLYESDEPDARIAIAYDHPSGAYVGASLIGGKTDGDAFHGLGFVAYLGFAGQTPGGINWDFGASISEINIFLNPPTYTMAHAPPYPVTAQEYPPSQPLPPAGVFHYRADYSEVYGGISWRDTTVYAYVSPDYLGQDLRTVYLDVTQSFRPAAHVRLYCHAGVLTRIDGPDPLGAEREHYDVAAGAAYEFHHGQIELFWTGISPQVQYPAGYPQKRNAVILSMTGFL